MARTRDRVRGRLRRFWFGVGTIVGLRRFGFFIPYRYARAIPPAAGRAGYPAVEHRFRTAEDRFRDLLRAAGGYSEDLRAFGSEPPPCPRWNQDWFTGLDAIAAYVLVRERAPSRLVEVGSGHSTRVFVRAARDAGARLDITCIDPAPRAVLGGLDVRWIRSTIQDTDDAVIRALEAGDMLSVDASHILMPGTDVDVVLNRILPMLPTGVLVHIHDVFLPDDYPADWDWRGYNEQLGVVPLLLGGRWRIVWASHYVRTRMSAAARIATAGRPIPETAFESSLWIEKRASRPGTVGGLQA
jgi:hypothetical protein